MPELGQLLHSNPMAVHSGGMEQALVMIRAQSKQQAEEVKKEMRSQEQSTTDLSRADGGPGELVDGCLKMDEGSGEQVDGCSKVQMDGRLGEQVDGCSKVQVDGGSGEQVDGCSDGQTEKLWSRFADDFFKRPVV